MVINDGVLLSVNESDLDANGALRIPEGVHEVTQHVGDSLNGLTAIYLPDSLINIRKSIFSNNPSLTYVHFGNNINFIGYDVFEGCKKLNTISIPNTRINMLYPTLFPHLKKIIRRNQDGTTETFPLKMYSGLYHYEESSRKIGNIKISKLYTVYFHDDFMKNFPKICISLDRKGKKFFMGDTVSGAAIACRKYFLTQELEHAIWKYKVSHEVDEYLFEGYANILRHAIQSCIKNPYIHPIKRRIEIARSHIKNIPVYLRYIEKFFKKYDNTNDNICELNEISIERLLQKIKPLKTKEQTVCKSCTHWLKKHPVSASEMFSIVRAGYKNPGAFPYGWLKKIPKSERGAATKQMHKLFKKAAVRMYSPDNAKIQNILDKDTLDALSTKLSKIIKQPVEIKYLGSGSFSKTYTINIPECQKYVWKIYHCDTEDSTMSSYYHDTELQNSFLFGGKKYSGATKFRRIATAGISNQRGEIYLIYPYTTVKPSPKKIYRPFELARKYTLVDSNSDNFLGHTIIDTGAIKINYENWQQPRYVSKIMNTVLYQSWNALGYVLNNYSNSQIKLALGFIEDKTSRNHVDFKNIQSKIAFLKSKIKVR